MGTINEAFSDVFRDYATAGVPSSGAHDPEKSAIRSLGPLLESVVGGAMLGSVDVSYATRAALNADLAWAADSIAFVYADPTDANNDLYVKTGASGAGGWTLTTRVHDLVGGRVDAKIESDVQPLVDEAAGYAADAETAAVNAQAEAMLTAQALAMIPGAVGYLSTAGRLERYADGKWRAVPADRPRVWTSDDGKTRYLMADPAVPAACRAAPCHLPLASPNLQQVTYVTGTGATTYATGHAGPDLYGLGEGRSIKSTPGSSLLAYFANLAVVPATEVARFVFTVTFASGVARELRIGGRKSDGTTKTAIFKALADGSINYSAAGSAVRGASVFVDTLADDTKAYTVWVDIAVIAGETWAPLINFSAVDGSWNDSGVSALHVHSVRAIPDPTSLAPSPWPLVVDGALIADAPVSRADLRPLNAHWIGPVVSVGVCGDTTGAPGLPGYYHGYGGLPLYERVELSTGGAEARREFLLPCPQAANILADSRVVAPVLGPGWFDVKIERNVPGVDDFDAVTGAYDEPRLYPRLRYYERRFSSNAKKFSLTRVVGHRRVADSDMAATQQSLHVQAATEAIVTDVMVLGVNATAHLNPTLGYAASRPGSTVSADFNRGDFGGGLRLERNTLNTITRFAGGGCQNLCTAIQATAGTAGTLNVDGFAGFFSTGDMLFLSTGTWALSLQNAFFGANSNPMYDTIQMQNEIQVDVGAGWQNLSATALALADLPLGRLFYHAGSWSGSPGSPAIDSATASDRLLMKVDGWVNPPLGNTYINRANFEFQGSRLLDVENDVFYEVPNNSVWVSERNGTPSPTNPRIRLFAEYGYYTAGPTYTASATIPSQNTGMHGDAVQLNTTCFLQDATFNNIAISAPLSQGLFLASRAGGVDELTGTNIVCAAGQGNGITIDSDKVGLSGVKTFSNTIVLTVEDGHRFAPSGAGVVSKYRSEGVSGGFTLGANVWGNTDTTTPTGILATAGGSITGTLNKFAIAKIANFTDYTPPATDQPAVRSIENVIDPSFAQLSETYRIMPTGTPDSLVFREEFCDASGVDWNAIVTASRETYDKFLAAFNAFRFIVPVGREYPVNSSAAVGTVIASGFRGARITEGDMFRYFQIVGDELQVAKALPSAATAERAFGLEFIGAENVLIRVVNA